MQKNLSNFKTQLRTASQIFSQRQAKNDHQGNITRADIATLLRQENIALAREKAEKLLQDDLFSDLLGELDVHLGLITEHVQELGPGASPSPTLVEAAATVIYATPFVHSKELDDIRNFLVHCLGPTFGRSAATNQDHYVSKRVLRLLPSRVPSAFELDVFLKSVAATHAVEWSPDPQRHDMVNALSEILDSNSPISTIDLEKLRQLSQRGLPDEPSFLRPRIWRILLGTLPPVKNQWIGEAAKQRDSYYDLARRLLNPFFDSPPPHSLQEDTLLLNVWRQLSSLPPRLFSLLEEALEPETPNPLYVNPEEGKASLAEILSLRLRLLHNDDSRPVSHSPTPEIRLEADGSAEEPDNDDTPLTSSTSTTLVLPRSFLFAGAHPKHCQALLRLLFLHSMINPGNLFAHSASVLVAVYSVMNHEVEPNGVVHIEADTFWLFAAIVAEFSPLEDDSGAGWFHKFEECIKWADFDLYVDLDKNGLNPSLPHYSYRWIMPVLTHTLPLSSVFVLWDSLFAHGSRTRDSHPRLDHLIDICAAMLIRKKSAIARLGHSSGQRLWLDEGSVHPNGDMTSGGEGFAEGLKLLQQFNVSAAGGVDRILQTANDLAQRRAHEAAYNARAGPLGIGARITGTVWKGLMSRSSSGQSTQSEDYDSSDSDTDATQEPEDRTITASSSLASKLTDAVWKGITNQSAMEPDSPTLESPPEAVKEQPMPDADKQLPPNPQDSSSTASIWGYAERLRNADTMATLSRVGSTWRSKGILGSWGATSNEAPPPVPEKSAFSTPPRPFSPPVPTITSPDQEDSPSSGGFLSRTKSLLSSTRSPPSSISPKPSPRVPRPLLLGSAPVVTTPSREGSPRSSQSTPDNPEWAEVMRMKKQHFHRDSYSSVSSLSPSDAYARVPRSARSDWESDGSASRVVSLNRRSVSPMAPSFRTANSRMRPSSSRTSSISSASPLSHSRSPTPSKLDGLPTLAAAAQEVLTDSPPTERRPSFGRRPSEPLVQEPSDVSDSDGHLNTGIQSLSLSATPNGSSTESGQPQAQPSHTGPSRMPRVRTKRQIRPANLQIGEAEASRVDKLRVQVEQKLPSPSNLGVEWPQEDGETLTTPKATSFEDGDEQGSMPRSASGRRARKVSTGDRKGSADTINGNAVGDRPRKVSSGARARKVSAEKYSRRDSAAEEGDDEGYDDLLSAYESEEGHGAKTAPR